MGELVDPPVPGIGRPERLHNGHDLSPFDCKEGDLSDWLRKRAIKNEGRTSRTYVVCEERRVVGYYSLANGSISRSLATSKAARNTPDPVPIMVIGRLAVDRHHQRRGIGSGMLRDAVLRTIQASEVAGIAAVLVHAMSEEAKTFYTRWGFEVSPFEPMTLMITLRDAITALDY